MDFICLNMLWLFKDGAEYLQYLTKKKACNENPLKGIFYVLKLNIRITICSLHFHTLLVFVDINFSFKICIGIRDLFQEKNI